MRQTDVESSYGGSYAGQSGQPYAAGEGLQRGSRVLTARMTTVLPVSSPNKDVDELDVSLVLYSCTCHLQTCRREYRTRETVVTWMLCLTASER
eukprot:197929-Hanusia_phi.AAC.7